MLDAADKMLTNLVGVIARSKPPFLSFVDPDDPGAESLSVAVERLTWLLEKTRGRSKEVPRVCELGRRGEPEPPEGRPLPMFMAEKMGGGGRSSSSAALEPALGVLMLSILCVLRNVDRGVRGGVVG